MHHFTRQFLPDVVMKKTDYRSVSHGEVEKETGKDKKREKRVTHLKVFYLCALGSSPLHRGTV